MGRPRLHVLFNPSGAGTLREVLKGLGRNEVVACPFDDFSFGPLQGGDAARVAWVDEVLGYDNWEEVTAKTALFLDAACSDAVLPVAWVSRGHAHDHAGFLWWLSHLGDGDCKVIDITDRGVAPEGSWRPAISPASLTTDEMTELLDTEVDLSVEQRAAHRTRWAALTAENAPLRLIGHDGLLTSAPLDVFDPLLLSFATETWRRPAWLVGHAIVQFLEDHISQSGDLVLFARVWALVEAGALEARGDTPETWEVRLPG